MDAIAAKRLLVLQCADREVPPARVKKHAGSQISQFPDSSFPSPASSRLNAEIAAHVFVPVKPRLIGGAKHPP